MTQEEFAKSIKTKYPQYKDIDTGTLVTKIVEKYPIYQSQITDLPKPKKFGSETVGDIKETGQGIADVAKSRFAKGKEALMAGIRGEQGIKATALQIAGQGAGAVSDIGGELIMGAGKAVLPQGAETAISETTQKVLSPVVQSQPVQNLLSKYEELKTKNPEQARNIDALLGISALGLDIATLGSAKTVTTAGKEAVESGFKSAVKTGTKTVSKVSNTIEDTGSSFFSKISQPDVSEATKVSLNPQEALKGTTQDIRVSVGGKMRPLSELDSGEISQLRIGTLRNVENFTKQAEKFAKDRSVEGGSPVEQVGSRTDKALTFADKKRQLIGNKMGVIEEKFADTVVPMKDNTFKSFADIVDYSNNPKYGVQSQNATVVKKLIDDFDALNANGLTVSERNNFVRTWQQYLADAKDPFGNFKENATANTKIQNAVNSLKNETVESIPNKTYRKLRKQYAEYKKLEEIGNQLLGKDGLLGERIKGAATVKRAVQSNSDAGARQFLIKLRDLTGYDAIKEGDLALTAMENVGDYQGLNLLNIIKEGKSGLVNKALEKGQDILVGDKATRVKKYIKK